MPIHKEIDKIGISSHLREGTMDTQIYGRWLITTYEYISGFHATITRSSKNLRALENFVPTDLGISRLEEDLKYLNLMSQIQLSPQSSELDTHDELIVANYTLLGSLMGSEMIFRFVKGNLADAPTAYLEHIMTHKGSWKPFLDYIGNVELHMSDESFSSYVKEYWENILKNYQDKFL